MTERDDAHVEVAPQSDPIDEAQMMGEWFGLYVYNGTDKVGHLPRITQDRLERQFGAGNVYKQLEGVRDSLREFDDEHRSNLMMYICGYPDETLETLGDENLQDPLRVFDEKFPPVPKGEFVPSTATSESHASVTSITRTESKRWPVQRLKRVAPRKDDDTKPATPLELAPVPRSVPIVPGSGIWDPTDVGLPSERLPWMDDSLCAQVDPEAFFPEKGGSSRDAKKICKECGVRAMCLAYALENDERFGVWGGLSERERRRLQKKA